MSFLTRVQDLHQNLSWKLGHGRGKEGRAYSCPWWVDKMVYSLAYMQGKGSKSPRMKLTKGHRPRRKDQGIDSNLVEIGGRR
jgi:hypothetical protein